MYYKLLNKNVITVALVSLMMLGTIDTCDAQGVVSLVEEDNISAPKTDNAAESANQELPADDFDEFGLEIDAEIPETLEEDDGIIPLDDGLISPAPVVEKQEEPKAPAPATEAKPAEVKPVVENIIQNDKPVAEVPQTDTKPVEEENKDTSKKKKSK